MAAPVHVQAVSAQSAGVVASLASPSFTSTTGNLLAVIFGDDSAATYGATPLSDNKGNTYTQAVARIVNGTVASAALWYARNIAGGAGHVVTITATTNDALAIAVEEMSGADQTAPLDQAPAGRAPASELNPHNAAAIVPSVAGTLAVAGIVHGDPNNNTFAATGTGTVRTSQTNTANVPIALSTDTRTDTSSVTEGFNLTPNNSLLAAMVAANFKGAVIVAVSVVRAIQKGVTPRARPRLFRPPLIQPPGQMPIVTYAYGPN